MKDCLDLSASHLTQTTKALFLDKQAQAAVDNFKRGLETRVQQNAAKEDHLVSIFNACFANENREISIDEFKSKYLQT